jgi:uncharacterized protein (DUF849 family)
MPHRAAACSVILCIYLDTRIGLEDTLFGPDGERTAGNEALVRAARELGAGTD